MLEIQSNDEIEQAFHSVLEEFRHRYLLSFTPRGVDKAGWHRLQVRVRQPGAIRRAPIGHGTKLQQGEGTSAQPRTLLAKKDGRAHADANGDGDGGQQRRQHHQSSGSSQQIERAFESARH